MMRDYARSLIDGYQADKPQAAKTSIFGVENLDGVNGAPVSRGAANPNPLFL
ncbi:hypothetical protein [Thiosocius teredinicola]|uniref:hypothetical protein n=1 Tax=Thiosocius teredinicola TaxID=1973002 RepID=UPI0013DE66AB